MVKLHTVVKPYTMVKPHTVVKPGTMVKPHTVAKPYTMVKPHTVVKPDTMVKPHSGKTRHNGKTTYSGKTIHNGKTTHSGCYYSLWRPPPESEREDGRRSTVSFNLRNKTRQNKHVGYTVACYIATSIFHFASEERLDTDPGCINSGILLYTALTAYQ